MPQATLAKVTEAYRRAMPDGTIEEQDLTVLDRTGVPTVAVSWAAPGHGATGTGYGATLEAARVGAFGELSEGIFPEQAATSCPTVTASYDEMCARHGPGSVADPLTLGLPAGSPYSSADRLIWATAVRWRTGEAIWLPIEFLASEAGTVERRFPSRPWLITPVTNGLGAGLDLEQAVSHALLEILQRDGDTVSFRALDQGVVLDLAGVDDPVVTATIGRLQGAGIRPLVKVAADELVPVVYCVGDSPGLTEPEPIALSAIGEAAHPDPAVAIRKALLEFAASRARRIFSFGSIANLAAHLPDYAATVERAAPASFEERRAFEAMRKWCAMSSLQLRTALDPIFRHTGDAKVGDFTTARPPGDQRDLLPYLLDVLANFDVLVMAGADSGPIRTAKVVVPGLEVETLSYLRIGPRVARRLLERGSDLVGRGEANGEDQLQVRCDAQGTEEMGGPVWLDRSKVALVLGDLYPLYREPSRHTVPLSLRS